MSTTIEATYDGSVFRPTRPVPLPPNTAVRLTVEPVAELENGVSFLETAESLKLEGPADWATNIDKYLYGEGGEGAA